MSRDLFALMGSLQSQVKNRLMTRRILPYIREEALCNLAPYASVDYTRAQISVLLADRKNVMKPLEYKSSRCS